MSILHCRTPIIYVQQRLSNYLISAKSDKPRHQTVSASLAMQVYLEDIRVW